MNADASEPLKQLHKVLAELEGLANAAANTAGEGGTDLLGRLKGTLDSARTRMCCSPCTFPGPRWRCILSGRTSPRTARRPP